MSKNPIKRLQNRKTANELAPQKNVPRITNETVAAHREEVIGSARKYIYPLEHSKHRIVILSTLIFITTLAVFLTYTTLALYKFQHTSAFMYRVTQVIPFPVARTGNIFIAYENYLFEVRRYQHYYENQLKVDFTNPRDKEQLAQAKRQALEKVINDAYIKQLAQKHNISVSDQEVTEQISIARNQNRLGGSEQVFEDVLKDYWGWSLDDFKQSLRQQLLAEKVVATIDTETIERAQKTLQELQNGADFAEAARKYSDEEGSKENGGEYGFAIDRTSHIHPKATDTLFKLKPGEISGIVNTGTTLEIFKNIEENESRIRAAHIVFRFNDIESYINELKEQRNYRLYLRLPAPLPTEEIT